MVEARAGVDRRSWLAGLAAIACLAAALRLPRLGAASFWVDECHTIESVAAVRLASVSSLVAALFRGFSSYFLLLAPWVGPQTPEWEARLPSALAGIALPLVLAWVGRDLGGAAIGRRLGVAASISPYLVWHSREARWYPLTWLLVGIAALCFVRARRRGTWHWVLGCVAAGLAAASTFAPAIVLLPIQLAWLGWESRSRTSLRQDWRQAGRLRLAGLLAGLAAGSLVAGVWIWDALVAPALTKGSRGYEFSQLGGPTLGSVGHAGVAFATGYTLGPGPSEWHVRGLREMLGSEGPLLSLGPVALCGLMVLGLGALKRTDGPWLPSALLSMALLPPAVVLAASAWTDHTFAPRHAGIAYPFVLILAVAALGHPTRRRLAQALAGLLICLQAVAIWNLHTSPRYAREDIRGAARYVAAHAAGGDLVLVFGGVDLPWKHYYRGVAAWEPVKSPLQDRSSEPRILARLDQREPLWTVRGRLWERADSERLVSLVETRAPAAEVREFAGGVVVSRHPGADRR